MKMDKEPGTVKVTISLPAVQFERLEQERHRRGLTRSALFAELAARLVGELELRDLEARYTAGYERHPEGGDDLAWVAEAGASTLGAVALEDAHDWSGDYRMDCDRRAAG